MIDQPAVEQIQVPLRLRDPSGIMGRQADRRAARVQLAEHLHQCFTTFRIQVAGRLVGEQERAAR